MGNGSTKTNATGGTAKMEIKFNGAEPFKPGESISGEVIVTTKERLNQITGVEIAIEGGSWYKEPGAQAEREVYLDASFNLPISAGHLEPGIHRFAFSFKLPEDCKSTIVLSRTDKTAYFVKAVLKQNGNDLRTKTRDLAVLAPPDGSENHDDDKPFRAEVSGTEMSISLELPKRIFNPGEVIPISGTFVNNHKWWKHVTASIVAYGSGVIYDPSTAGVNAHGDPREMMPRPPAVKHLQAMHPGATVEWKDEAFFRLPANIPTESSLFHRFRNRRWLVIAMEDRLGHVHVELPVRIQIGN